MIHPSELDSVLMLQAGTLGLTSDFKLIVLLGLEQRVREAVPGQLLADLRQQVVGE